MSTEIYTELRWLPQVPADFKQRCDAVVSQENAAGAALRDLASHRLSENQLVRLARSHTRLKTEGRDLSPLLDLKLGIVSNATTSFLVPPIVASAMRHGLSVDCVATDFSQVLQNALDPQSALNRARCDVVLISVDYRGLPLNATSSGDASTADSQVETALAYINSIRQAIRRNSGAICLVQTLARPPEVLFGNLERTIPGTWLSLTQRFNQRLADSLDQGDLLLDVAAMAEVVGLANWHDPTLWNIGKLPFSSDVLPYYADQVARVLAAAKGKSRRTLVCDLDNTLWGGVIGDDGCQGISIGQGDATGEAYLNMQSTVLALRERGIVLAVSSKNNEAVARKPFREHPDMLLRESHIAAFRANWNDKATNISTIAAELSLGIDSMVFVDDNPFERNLVRESLPSVAVPELPEDPALYARTMLAGGYFEALTYSSEDRARADFYQDNARRLELQESATDLDAYLRSLDMEITFQPFDEVGRARITQLINKSNQFNLTTQRYTEAQIAALEGNPGSFTLQIRLKDKFGDNGMISVIICRQQGNDWLIDTWLMSCRVLGRRVEQAVLSEIVANARVRGISRVVGQYLPTERNELVREHYAGLGFVLIETLESGATVWELSTKQEVPMPAIITVAQTTYA